MALFEYEKLQTALKYISESSDLDMLSDELIRMIDSHTLLEQDTADRLSIAQALVKRIVRLGGSRALDFNHNGDGSFLHICLMSYDQGILNILIQNSADTRVKNSFGQTPFDTALVMLQSDRGEKLNVITRIIDMLR